MTLTTERVVGPSKTPTALRIVEVTLLFLGVTAIGGGVAMLSGVEGWVPPLDWLEAVPLIETWVIPGLVLAVGFGAGSLMVLIGMLRRWEWPWLDRLTGHHWSWIATIGVGLALLVWIGLELAYLPAPSGLQVAYGLVGLILTLTPMTSPVRHALEAR